MVDHSVKFDIVADPVIVPTGTLLAEAARLAGINIMQPCGGQGRCGRCVVQVTSGAARRRSALRLSARRYRDGVCLSMPDGGGR